MTTQQNDTAALTDEQLEGVVGGDPTPKPSSGPYHRSHLHHRPHFHPTSSCGAVCNERPCRVRCWAG